EDDCRRDTHLHGGHPGHPPGGRLRRGRHREDDLLPVGPGLPQRVRRGLWQVLAEARLPDTLHLRGRDRRQLSRCDRPGGGQAEAVAGSARSRRAHMKRHLAILGALAVVLTAWLAPAQESKPQWVVALADEADTLDPPGSPAFTAEQYMFHIYDGLTGVEGKDL